MARAIYVTLSCVSTGLVVSGCAMAPVQTAAGYANAGAHATYGVASTSAHAVYTTGGDVYTGVGQAAKQPLRDLNMMQDPIPAVLLRTESRPYDLAGVDSCEAVLNQVAELDLALGPDLDAPKDRGRDRTTRGADAAASAALLAAADAADHFIPMRSMIKEVSGATRYENHVKHAVLSGTVRRAFLKAIGMAHNCGWPASPLVFNPVQVAVASGAWTSPTEAGLQAIAIAAPAPLAVPSVAFPVMVSYRPSQMMAARVTTATVSQSVRTMSPFPARQADMALAASAQTRGNRAMAVVPAAAKIVPGRPVTVAAASPAPLSNAVASDRRTPMAHAIDISAPEPSGSADQTTAFASTPQPAFISSTPGAPWSTQASPHP